MEAAKQAILQHTSQKGHTTEVDELVHPGITNESIKPHRHEETTQAVNREVHQHHHHTTVQPIQHKEVLPEKHTHNLLPVSKSEFVHGDAQEHESRLAQMKAAFVDRSTTHETTHSTATAPQVVGEHVHHHVHEVVQPVIHKETVQPEVVHTTLPTHEVHHHHATHHGMSALPMKSLDEFNSAGGTLTGSRSSTHETYEGEPRPYNKELETTMDKLGLGHHGTNTTSGTMRSNNNGMGGRTGHGYTDSGVSGMGSTTGAARSAETTGTTAGMHDSSLRSTSNNLSSGQRGVNTPRSSEQSGNRDSAYGSPTSTAGVARRDISGGYGATSGVAGDMGRTSTEQSAGRTSLESGEQKKPSLFSRLNPMKDSDGDGKKGFMS